MNGFVRLGMVGLLVGCAGGAALLPRHLETGRHPAYPGDAFITGVGSSREGRAAAEVQARAEVCRQVRSHLRATTEDEAVFVARGGRSEVVSRFVQKAVQTAQCDFGELVRVVPELGAVSSGAHWAFAVLSRREALEALRPDFDKDAGVFRDRARAALAARDDLSRFTAEYNEARRALERALPRGLEIRSIAGGRYEPVSDLFALLSSLWQAASEARSRAVVAVVVERAPDPRGLERAVARWVGSSGIRTSVGAVAPGGLVLRVVANEECSLRLGLCCTWTVAATLCDADGSPCAPVSAPVGEGCDRRDRDAARHRLLQEYGGPDPARSANAALSGMLPMPPE